MPVCPSSDRVVSIIEPSNKSLIMMRDARGDPVGRMIRALRDLEEAGCADSPAYAYLSQAISGYDRFQVLLAGRDLGYEEAKDKNR